MPAAGYRAFARIRIESAGIQNRDSPPPQKDHNFQIPNLISNAPAIVLDPSRSDYLIHSTWETQHQVIASFVAHIGRAMVARIGFW